MTAAVSPALQLDRPSFWTEARDPEAWFRALEAISLAAESRPQVGTPRTVAERCLVGVIAWRGAVGLFGVSHDRGQSLLHGVGLVAQNGDGHWALTEEAQTLVGVWREDASTGLAELATHLVRESPWLRVLLLRLHRGDWAIDDWAHARSSRAGLKAGSSLRLERFRRPSDWFTDLESQTAGQWLARTHCARLAYSPRLAGRKKGKDDLSLSPLTAPLHLLETVGWLSPTGSVQLPHALQADLHGAVSPAEALAEISQRRADVRGVVAAEPVLRELLAAFGASPSDEAFAGWMDLLVQGAMATGALEVLSAEAGQARHGRGLFGDPARKLVRWVVHREFNDHFQGAWAALGGAPPARRDSQGTRGEEPTP